MSIEETSAERAKKIQALQTRLLELGAMRNDTEKERDGFLEAENRASADRKAAINARFGATLAVQEAEIAEVQGLLQSIVLLDGSA